MLKMNEVKNLGLVEPRVKLDDIGSMSLEQIKNERYFKIDDYSYADMDRVTEEQILRMVELEMICNIDFIIKAPIEELRDIMLESVNLNELVVVFTNEQSRNSSEYVFRATRRCIKAMTEEEIRICMFGTVKNDTREFNRILNNFITKEMEIK